MLEAPMIQTRGFRNRDSGFQLRLRLPYYRGLWASLLEGADVTVDGRRFPAQDIRWTIDGAEYSLDELRSSPTARWQVDVPATLSVPCGEPLALGIHDVSVDLALRMSYIPAELQPTIWSETRKLVISQ